MNKKNEEKNEKSEKNKITEKDLNNLDKFIQNCLDSFKFEDPKQELYEATGEDKNIIISHKSTIPDLVIWNKTFNKNNCFFDLDNNFNKNIKEIKFPRMMFFIKIKKNKKTKKNNNNNNNNININNNNNQTNNQSYNYNNNNEINNFIYDNNNNLCDKEINNNYDNQNIELNINNNNNYMNNYNNNIRYKKKFEEKNKFSINQNNIINNNDTSNNNKNNFFIENNLNNINKMINLTTYLIQLYLYKDGWIILNKDNFSGPGTSINLLQYLQEKIKDNSNLNDYIIIDINKKVKYLGSDFYSILSNILPKIFQKKQMELIKFEEIMSKHLNFNKNNNNNHININLYNNQIFPGINYIGNINNNISNANFIQNNITNYKNINDDNK